VKDGKHAHPKNKNDVKTCTGEKESLKWEKGEVDL
jgi:hypothetical protein